MSPPVYSDFVLSEKVACGQEHAKSTPFKESIAFREETQSDVLSCYSTSTYYTMSEGRGTA